MSNRQAVLDALKSDELANSLENISTDDKCEISDYTDDELVHEAKYVLSCFYESGHINNSALLDEYEEGLVKWAKKEIKTLKNFIKKYDK
jgi:hypothetical protein